MGTKKTQGILSFEAEYNEDVYPSAKYMIEEAVGKFHSQKFEDIAYFEPFYLKEFTRCENEKIIHTNIKLYKMKLNNIFLGIGIFLGMLAQAQFTQIIL